MKLVKGRGRNRKVLELPHGSIFATAAKDDPEGFNQVMGAIREIVLYNAPLPV